MLVDLSKLTVEQLKEIEKYVQGIPSAVSGNKRKETHIALVLDKSASMFYCLAPTIQGFNDNLRTIRNNSDKGGETFVSLYTFNHIVSRDIAHQPASMVPELTQRSYIPTGNTAMYDAIMNAINDLSVYDKSDVDASFLVSVFTDGQENASRTSGSVLSAKIGELTRKGNWTFAVAGANIDLLELSNNLNIPIPNLFAYNATPAGTAAMFQAATNSSSNYLAARSMGATASAGFYDDPVDEADKAAQNLKDAVKKSIQRNLTR